ncbi:MAG TPA: MFS transporter, partial [Acidimicrobiales bacterium]|nr:MFS transporter [Acidimicrobiales bacterium]
MDWGEEKVRHHTSGPGGAVGLLLIGQTTSLVGDWLLRVALPLHVLSVTGSAASTALTFAAATLPSILFGPFAGPVVELRDHRATMVGCDLVRAGVVGVLVVGPASDRPWLIYLVVATQASVSELFAPARTAIVPRILGEPDALARANSSLALGNEVALLLGPALGGLVYQSFGLRVAAALDVASYLVSAVATVRIPGSGPESDSRPAKRAPVLRAMTLGVKLVAADRCLGPLMVVSLVLFLGAGMLGPL